MRSRPQFQSGSNSGVVWLLLGPTLAVLAFLTPLPLDRLVARFWLAAVGLVAGGTLGAIAVGVGNGFAAYLRRLDDLAEALARYEERRVLSTGSQPPAPPGTASPDTGLDARRADRLAEIRLALRSSAWRDAATLLADFATAYPGDSEAARLTGDLTAARDEAAQALLARLASAREVNDPDRVIELRESLAPVLAADALRTLDRDLARWFMLLIQRRLRAGTVKPDVAVLAARVADSLDETAEGASLRASLPTLRRAAGLCPKCAQPYAGLANACPACVASALAQTAAATPAPAASPATPDWTAPPTVDIPDDDAPHFPTDPLDPFVR